jgi:hypothetical protein
MKRTFHHHCECCDPMCPEHRGASCGRDGRRAILRLLFRVDMEDTTGMAFCEGCADDAIKSGLFTNEGGY